MSPFLWPDPVVRPAGLPVGGDEQIRTVDPLLARQVLYHLSYTPVYTGCRCPTPHRSFESPEAFKIKQHFRAELLSVLQRCSHLCLTLDDVLSDVSP